MNIVLKLGLDPNLSLFEYDRYHEWKAKEIDQNVMQVG